MFLASRLRVFRAVSIAAASAIILATSMLAAVPVQADAVYPRPWDNTVTLSGHGFGHGHGMSQWGAYGAAQVGKLSWQKILAFYYPGTALKKLGNTSIRVRLDAVGPGILYVPNAAGLQLASAGGTPVALKQINSAAQPITRYRVRTLPTAGRLRVEALSSSRAGLLPTWTVYKDLATPVTFGNPSRGNLVDVRLKSGKPRTYRGRLVANWATATTITPVSVLPMESYLRAVVPAEMPSTWHPNALAAQAVAARSYANHNRENAPAGRTFDTCDTTSCQMYSGLPAEASAADLAIAATAGQTLTYRGKAAFTQFAASNGGWSSAGSQPYLVAKADPYDGAIVNGANSWTKSITVASIQAQWPAIGSYLQLRIISRDGHGPWGGRVLQAIIEGSTGSVAVTGATIRTAFQLRSDWFVPTNLRSAPSYPRDFSRDRIADVLAVVGKTGYLRMYPGNGASGWKPTRVIGTGFGGFTKVFTAGTWDVDAISDVMAQKADGSLWLYPGTAAGPLGAPRRIGSGWRAYNRVFPAGDFGGDGLSDLLARRLDGAMVLFSGNGSGGFLKSPRVIGVGWGDYTSVFSPGDFDGDGKVDVIARTPAGLLYLYPGNGTGGWLPRQLIGSGWGGYTTLMSSGDLSGDGSSDILGRSPDGRLWLSRGDGCGGLLPRQLVGMGWNIFSTVLP
jgi:SpoIID/LytB domain protein